MATLGNQSSSSEPLPLHPPAHLSYDEKLEWLDTRIADAKAYRGVLTEDYNRKTKGHLVDQLTAIREKLWLENGVPQPAQASTQAAPKSNTPTTSSGDA